MKEFLCNMKEFLCNWSIAIPIPILLFNELRDPIVFYIPEIGLFLNRGSANKLMMIIVSIWLIFQSFNGTCFNGSWTDLLFNLVPLELVCMLCFAQWHFTSAVILTILLLLFESVLFYKLRKDSHEHGNTRKRRQMNKRVFQRCTVLALAVICAVPCYLSLFKYDLQPPVYQSDQELMVKIFGEKTDAAEKGKDSEDPYRANMDLWACFVEEKWNRWTVSDKITIMQRLVDYESEKLGFPSTIVMAEPKMIGGTTLGAYSTEGKIKINVEHLAKSPVGECINTICHETYHSYQYYVVETLDWEAPVMNSAYFQELRTWAANWKDYTWPEDGYDTYREQPLEMSASEFAENETNEIMKYVNSATERSTSTGYAP